MFGLDEFVAAYSDSAGVWMVILIAILLGLRHATDPDHVAAVTTLVAGSREQVARRAAELGCAWGLGHAVTLFVCGLPILLLDEFLPARIQPGAETAIALVIVYLAVRLLVRWHHGRLHVHLHEHDGASHSHLHGHGAEAGHGHTERTRLGAFGIGLVHGVGGSAGVGILLVAAVESTALSVVSLGLLAIFTAVSMTVLSTGFGATLASRPVRSSFDAIAPALALASLGFGLWYGAAAWELAPYPF